jgi:hypothetical protein
VEADAAGAFTANELDMKEHERFGRSLVNLCHSCSIRDEHAQKTANAFFLRVAIAAHIAVPAFRAPRSRIGA